MGEKSTTEIKASFWISELKRDYLQTIDESSSGRSLEIVDKVHDILLVRAIKDFYDERVPSSYLAQ